MPFSLGARSRAQLDAVHPALRQAVQRAIGLTTQDFAVWQGLRTAAEQKQNVATGVSRTSNSLHLLQADGYAHAVDLVPWVDGKPLWDWPRIYPIAVAMRTAAADLSTVLRWGGVWDRKLHELDPTKLAAEVKAYTVRHAGSDLLDGPHFEIARVVPVPAVLKA